MTRFPLKLSLVTPLNVTIAPALEQPTAVIKASEFSSSGVTQTTSRGDSEQCFGRISSLRRQIFANWMASADAMAPAMKARRGSIGCGIAHANQPKGLGVWHDHHHHQSLKSQHHTLLRNYHNSRASHLVSRTECRHLG